MTIRGEIKKYAVKNDEKDAMKWKVKSTMKYRNTFLYI